MIFPKRHRILGGPSGYDGEGDTPPRMKGGGVRSVTLKTTSWGPRPANPIRSDDDIFVASLVRDVSADADDGC